MGNGSSRSSIHDLQMSCPNFIIDGNKTAQHENNVHLESNALRKANDIKHCWNEKAGNCSPSTYKTPLPLPLDCGSDSFSGRDCVHDSSPGDQASGDDSLRVPEPSGHQSLKCQERNRHLGRNYRLGFSDRQFVYSHATEHSKHHQFINFDDSLRQSYPALTISDRDSQSQQQVYNPRNQKVVKMESLEKNDQNIPQNDYIDQNSCNGTMSSVDPRDSVQFMNKLPSSGGFVLSNNHQINSSSTQSSSNDFAPPRDIDVESYNLFFAGAVAKTPVGAVAKPLAVSFDWDSLLQNKVSLNEESNSSSHAERNLKLGVLPGSPFVEKPVGQLSSRMSGCEIPDGLSNDVHAPPPTSEIIYPSLIGYCSSFGGDSSLYLQRNEGAIWSTTGEFQPCSVDPDLSLKQSQRHRSERDTEVFLQHQSEANNCDYLSVNNTNRSHIGVGGDCRGMLRTCSGYSSCSNYEDDEEEEGVVAIDSNMECPSLDHEYLKSCDSERHNSCLSTDSQYDFGCTEGTRQCNSIISKNDEREDLENNVPATDRDDNSVIGGKCTLDSFRKIEVEDLPLCKVEARPDALSIYDGIANRPVMFSALMCVAPEDIETFAMSFLGMLKSWGFQIFFPIRDLNPTGPYHENLTRVIKERCNEKLIVIVSKDYPKSDECLFLTYFAKYLDPAAHQRNIIPIYIDKAIPNIPNVLSGLSSIHYNQAFRNGFLREKLEKALNLKTQT